MYESLQLQLKNLPESGWQWRGEVPQALLENGELGEIAPLEHLAGAADWQVTIARHDELFLLRGRWHVAARRECRRCTRSFVETMVGECERTFRLTPAESDEDEAELLPLPGHLDLLDVLREDFWVNWQGGALCRPDCKGLCAKCGTDLNEGSCSCNRQEGDNPFAKLLQLKFEDK